MTLWLWIREDGPPKVIETGKAPPGPGPVFAVSGVKTSDEARQVYARSLSDLPDVAAEVLEKLNPGERRERRVAHAEIVGDRERVRLVGTSREAVVTETHHVLDGDKGLVRTAKRLEWLTA